MTDLEIIKDMLRRANLKYEEHPMERRGLVGGVELTIEAGYFGFYTSMVFNNGKLVEMGAYE